MGNTVMGVRSWCSRPVSMRLAALWRACLALLIGRKGISYCRISRDRATERPLFTRKRPEFLLTITNPSGRSWNPSA